MLALTLILPMLVASTGECYLVTSFEIREIPCDFSAATTDALRYEVEDSPEWQARRAEQEREDKLKPKPRTRPTFPRRSRR